MEEECESQPRSPEGYHPSLDEGLPGRVRASLLCPECGADGRFTLKDLPPGEYTIEAWHERFGTRSQKVALGPKETKEVEFAFAAG